MESDGTETEQVLRMPLKSLGLKPGMALQTRRLVEGASKKESQYFGAIEGKGVMVGPLGADGTKTELDEGEVCVVRGFTGQYEYSFLTKVLQTFEKPFAYALLAYPAQVDARRVRRSMRTKTSWPSKVSLPAPSGLTPGNPLSVTLIDISTLGAMVSANSPLAAIGTPLELTLDVLVDGSPTALQLNATICHNNRGDQEGVYFIGMAFRQVSQQDKLLLHYLTQPTSA
jgi:c-di-GMP-binding flagellar brake protein YcgR